MGKNFTVNSVKLILTGKYKCKFVGNPLPKPYGDCDDAGMFFTNPNGHEFFVPPPPSDLTYTRKQLDRIIETARIEVVVPFEDFKKNS